MPLGLPSRQSDVRQEIEGSKNLAVVVEPTSQLADFADQLEKQVRYLERNPGAVLRWKQRSAMWGEQNSQKNHMHLEMENVFAIHDRG